MSAKIGFLGPKGTFAEEALVSRISVREEDLVPYPTVKSVINAVEKGKVSQGIVPIENSIEGSVNETLDILTFETNNAVIEQEIVIPITHNLVGRSNLRFSDIEAVVSHPQAVAQCRAYLAKKLPGVSLVAANSTAEAVKKVAEEAGSRAAIGTQLAAKIYGLTVLAANIGDFKDNRTRFVLVGKKQALPTGNDKTSVVCFIHKNKPGR
jgi:prephenate dehydratase